MLSQKLIENCVLCKHLIESRADMITHVEKFKLMELSKYLNLFQLNLNE